MIHFKEHKLANGLRVIIHEDHSTPLAALNIAYNIGSKHEKPHRTGFAHLFEHLMFGGSKNIPNYDDPLQLVGGDNNAYTTIDLTNYYLTLPANNLETGFWLESDRMLELDFSQKSLDTQKSVVIEEFKQRYLNQPYGDVWPLIRSTAYKVHPYQWPTIGKSTEHIGTTTLDEVKEFFYSHYAPNNAVLVAAGNVCESQILEWTDKWFGAIPFRPIDNTAIPVEPKQIEKREVTVERDVPFDAIYMAWHMCDRLHPDYYATDLISDILSNGQSSRLFRKLVIEQKLFNELDAYITGDHEPGLFVIAGKLNENISISDAQKAIEKEIESICNNIIEEYELQKVKNKVESTLLYTEMNFLNKAMNLANFSILNNTDLINQQGNYYQKVTPEDIHRVANTIFTEANCSIIHYLKKR